MEAEMPRMRHPPRLKVNSMGSDVSRGDVKGFAQSTDALNMWWASNVIYGRRRLAFLWLPRRDSLVSLQKSKLLCRAGMSSSEVAQRWVYESTPRGWSFACSQGRATWLIGPCDPAYLMKTQDTKNPWAGHRWWFVGQISSPLFT